MAGKGDLRRPAAVPKAQVDAEYDRIFRSKRKPRCRECGKTYGRAIEAGEGLCDRCRVGCPHGSNSRCDCFGEVS